MSQVIEQYSGIVVNQNQKPSEASDYITLDNNWRYQEVFLPSDYPRGTKAGEQIIPPLSGWQLLVGVDSGSQKTASLEWVCQYDIFGIGWVTLTSGTATGIHTEGDQVWMDLLFNNPADLGFEIMADRFRFGFRKVSGVNKVWYSNPNPLALRGFARLYEADGITPIQDSGSDVSVCFRVLGLTVDDGTDFLGNTYRSALRSNVAENTNTVDGSTRDAVYMSEPAPSRFAIKNLYYDVRQITPIKYGAYNYIKAPSFEPGVLGTWWTSGLAGASVSNEWAFSGTYSYKFDTGLVGAQQELNSPTGTNGMPVHANRNYTLKATVNVTLITGANVTLFPVIRWYNAAGTLVGTSVATVSGSAQALGVKEIWVDAMAPGTAAYAGAQIIAGNQVGSERIAGYIDSVIFAEGTNTSVTYFDGDMPHHRWSSAPNNSASVEVIESSVTDGQAVIDNVLVDPVTPGVWFSVYYSNEEGNPTSEEEWENKLWTRVNANFHATKRESHKLPQPILAKFIKVEFSHLQARSYNPGDFAKPVKYKKHPKWVLDYFLARLDSEQAVSNGLVANRVAVIYNALDLAFNYYLDDLKQEPDQPVEVDSSFINTLSSFLNTQNDLSDQVDSVALDKINIALQPYQNHPTTFAKSSYLLGQQTAAAAAELDVDYATEKTTVPGTDVGSLRNASVVFENDFPVMFFYITCRHKYREIVAPFTHDRAYFVGVREIAFTRDRYTASYDNDQYIEPAGDLFNVERNDFNNDGGTMTVLPT